jgi:hypothetical protein
VFLLGNLKILAGWARNEPLAAWGMADERLEIEDGGPLVFFAGYGFAG